ncbi:MAG: beta-galactosidase, partial [Candidatus Methylomirabilis sp.]|nr:beta-galactosidase [Deltaproteobacteria bacterium]
MTVSLTPHGLRVGEEDLPLISGAMHYWRVPRAKWGECLDRVAEMGFRIVETYVPWSVHEVERGRFDFGERDPGKDFSAFARLVQDKGLKLLVRPGPHINAEITYFGYPKRLFAIEDALSRGPEGAPVILPVFPRMFPAPSYASERFYEEARLWFDAVGPRIAELVWPKGPIVGVQADNELSFFFRTSLFDQDYSEAALSLYRKFARETYGELGEANRVWGTDYAGWDTVAPPRRFEPQGAPRLPYYLDWAAFKESLIRHGLRRCTELLAAAGVAGAPIYHNHPPAGTGSPFDIATAER